MSAAQRSGGSSSTGGAAARPAATKTVPQETEKSGMQLENEKAANRIKHWEATVACANKNYYELIAFDRAVTKAEVSRIVGSNIGLIAVQRLPQLGVDLDDKPLEPVQVMPVGGHVMENLETKYQFRTITVVYGNEERDASILLRPRQSARAAGATR